MIGLVSTSSKHGARGAPNSAIEEIIHALDADLTSRSFTTSVFSFRENRLPMPDGRPLTEKNDPACRALNTVLTHNRFLIVGVTAYMGHISSASKALFEHVAGANYDIAYPENIPETDTFAVVVTVGTDRLTTSNGANEAMDLRSRLGWRGGEILQVNNPRSNEIDYSSLSYGVFSQLLEWCSQEEQSA